MLFVDIIRSPIRSTPLATSCSSQPAFALFGFILGMWADGFEKLQIVPLLILTPLTFLGGTFYSIKMLAEPWRTIAQFNPMFYLISGLRWTFIGRSDVPIGLSLALHPRLHRAVHLR